METVKESLMRKYQPKSLNDIVGNTDVKNTLETMFTNGIKHGFIAITGEHGLGKTALARVIAREFVGEGNTSAVAEADLTVASTSSVKAVLFDAIFENSNNERRVIILDECQFLLTRSQNALVSFIKAMDTNVLVIMCTTNTDSLEDKLKDLVSISFNMTEPDVGELVSFLESICKQEGIEFDVGGLELVAERAEMRPRQALVYLNSLAWDNVSATLDILKKWYIVG